MANRIKLLLVSIALCFSISAINAQADADVLTKVKTSAGYTNYTALQLKSYINTGVGTGSVTSASVVSANGFAGTVSNASTTPAITLTTTASGVLKGNGTAISAAVAGTDYVIPSGSITGTAANVTGTVVVGNGGTGAITLTGLLKGNGTSAFSTATAGTDYVVPSGSITGTSANVTGLVAIVNGGTGSSTQNFVDLSNTQTSIGGAKTFTSALTSSGSSTLNATIFVDTTITTTSNLSVVKSNATINNGSTAITLTIPTGLPTGYCYFLKLADTSTGVIIVSSSENVYKSNTTTATITGGAGVTYRLQKNNLGYWSMD